MKLNKNEFIILRALEQDKTNTIEVIKDIPLDKTTIEETLNLLESEGLVDEQSITDKGYEALQPYKVNNAIIMAAGMSSRFAPLSYENPKGLLNVKGEVLIERQINQLHEAGIKDITIVLGYMAEKFEYLKDKYNVKLVLNKDYYKYNNTSTLMLVLDRLSNTYICSSDNYLGENIFNQYEYKSFYPVVAGMEDEAGEYYVTTNSEGRIVKLDIGTGKLALLGPVYFDKTFSDTFKAILEEAYVNEETKLNLWEKLYLNHLDSLDMNAIEYPTTVVYEFDSLEELQNFDETYLEETNSEILKNIMKVLKCEIKDIKDIVAIKDGLTNLSFKFTVNDEEYIYRHPGVGTDEYINRNAEFMAQSVALENEIDKTLIIMDKEEGWKISRFIPNARILDYDNPKDIDAAMELLRKLHQLGISEGVEFNAWNKIDEFIERIHEKDIIIEGLDNLYADMKRLYKHLSDDNVPKILSHCDFYDPNILFDEDDKCYLIDWEYAGIDDPAVDLGTFIACASKDYETNVSYIRSYYEGELSDENLRHQLGYVAIMAFYWYVWALFQESNGKDVGDYLSIWRDYSEEYVALTLDLYK